MERHTANLLGALCLAVSDRVAKATREAIGHAGETPAAIVLMGLEPGLSTERLRTYLGLSHPGAVRLVDRLVADGYVERRPGKDAREGALHLTTEGKRARSLLHRRRCEAIARALVPLSVAEQKQLAALVTKMLQGLPTTEAEMYSICRLCNEHDCPDCPLQGDVYAGNGS